MNNTLNTSFGQSRPPPGPRNDTDMNVPYGALVLKLEWSIGRSTYLPFVVFGIVGNLASLWIWHAQKRFNPTTFLFKYLAVADLGFLVGETILHSQKVEPRYHSWKTLPGYFGKVFQVMSVTTTLAVAVFRLLAVWRPIHAPLMLSRGRVLAVGAAIFVWSLAAEIVHLVAMTCFSFYSRSDCTTEKEVYDTLYRHKRNEVVTFFIPLVLMLFLNMAIVWKIRHRGDVTTAMTQEQRAPITKSSQHITQCVVVITATCVVCYPLSFIVRWALYGKFSTRVVASFAVVSYLLTYVNSSVNVIYYWIFTSEFRLLTAARVASLCHGLRTKTPEAMPRSASKSIQLSTINCSQEQLRPEP